MKRNILHSTLDAFVLATFSLLLIPLLLFGFSPIYLLIFHILLGFLYYILKDRGRKELAMGLVFWPFATIILSIPFSLLFFIQTSEIISWWFSIPGLILFVLTAVGAMSALILTKVVMKENQGKTSNEI